MSAHISIKTTLYMILRSRYSHLDSINRVHDRVLLIKRQSAAFVEGWLGGNRAYSYASKSACGHVLHQRKVGRESFITIEDMLVSCTTTLDVNRCGSCGARTHTLLPALHLAGPLGRPRPQILLRTYSIAEPGCRLSR